jgi:cell division septation protein DedD
MAAKNRRMFELRLGKLGIILFVGGMSLLLFSMFFMGIFVGKHMEAYPEKFSPSVAEMIRDRILALAPQTGQPAPSAVVGKRDSPAGGEENFDLTFYETLGGKQTRPAAGEPGAVKDEPSETSVPAPVPAEKSRMTDSAGRTAAGTIAANTSAPPSTGDGGTLAPDPEKKPVATGGAAPSTTIPAGVGASGKVVPGMELFEIQVAAYQDNRKAVRTMESLKPLGFSPRVIMKEVPGKGKWYRVIIGGFDSREKAKTAAELISGKVRGVKCVIRPSGRNGGE